VLTKDKVTQCQ